MIYKWEGISDEVFTCEHCGRINLKKTIMLKDEIGEINYFGSECAIKLLGWSKAQLKEEIKREENKKKKAKEDLIKKARFQYYKHPNIIKMNCEISEANRNKITPAERKEKGLFSRWMELQRQAQQEIKIRLNIPENVYFWN